ncbi:MAG: sensor domain-containing diguanylate cyclase [Pyrinomonadaceae bacterium]|nr:sensor domain-containing diguanylate cyclase [Pyrinomonadaceae bacterium]MDQ3584825.1 GGDEF domain-containing protein [Acidobacteriota bacterium]
MSHVILLKSENESPAPALVEALREAGVSAEFAAEATAQIAETSGAAEAPLAVIYEVIDGVELSEINAWVKRASVSWPGASLIACGHTRQQNFNRQTLLRLGFHAIADELAQIPALLREVDESSAREPESKTSDEHFASELPGVLLPAKLKAPRLRAAFEVIAALHFAGDQKGAAQIALAGLASLVNADRWIVYLIEERGPQPISFEPLAARGALPGERALPVGDWRRALTGDALLALTGTESKTARQAVAGFELIRKAEAGRRLLAVPLVSGERVLGVIEAVREGAGVKGFSMAEAGLVSALALPIAAALANSVRIADAERLSMTDDLTKLHNARFLRQFLNAEIKRARRYKSAVSAIFIDLDNFKEINDHHGHLAGSHVLIEMATVILMGVRDTDMVARYGGDEFVVILPETSAEMAALVAERIREKIEIHHFTGGRNLRRSLTASFGVASFPRDAQSPQQLLADADAAMYAAKAARKNCVRSAGQPKSD